MAAVSRSQILLVEDQPLFCAGLAQAVGRESDLALVAGVVARASAAEMLATTHVDLVIVDMLMSHSNGISLANEMLAVRPELKILALSVVDEAVTIATMLRAGARGYALKTQSGDEIIVAIRTVLAGNTYLPPHVPHETILAMVQAAGDRRLARLTRRECEIFNLLIRGNTNEQIGSLLFISRRTVETHRLHIMRKLATPSLIEMIRLAAREGALTA
jgi:DNA-binding NarL/FixJ family response regulator